ncbi:MAG: N-formylglutamate amidohydrolase [Micavibrio sp.]|nr:N-formylglutamate amidohydrolase [Micavibrio sp.]
MGTKDNNPGIYTILRPSGVERPLIFDSPHSGHNYPDDFNHACPRDALLRAEDNEVDILFADVTQAGASLLTALFPRTYIDVNRAEDDIDTELLAERWPGPLNPTSRSYAGIGLLRRLVKPGIPVYDRALTVAEVRARIGNYYHPYHAALRSLLDDAHYRFGKVWHINCHSMPSSSAAVTNGVLSMQPDFVLGDRDGTSCDLGFTHFLRDALRTMGYRVAINNPYKGVELVRRSANPAEGRHSIQIEISKGLYWDENKNERIKNFSKLKGDIDKLVEACGIYVDSHLSSLAAD